MNFLVWYFQLYVPVDNFDNKKNRRSFLQKISIVQKSFKVFKEF